MKRVCGLFIVLSACSWAQNPDSGKPYNGNFYGFANFGACQHGYGIFGGGAGAEALVWKGLSVGADSSYQQFSDGWGFTFLNGQVGYHFVDRKAPLRWDPFVTFGVGGVFASRGGTGWTANVGGGATYWFKPRIGFRFEFRMHGMVEEGIATGRIGISFR